MDRRRESSIESAEADSDRRSDVSFEYYLPGPPLSDFVDRFWYWKGHHVSRSKERVLPTGTVEVAICLGSDRISDSVISGPRSAATLIERTAQDELLGIHFKPGGAFPFLKLPFGELHNLEVGLDDCWGASRSRQLLSLLSERTQPQVRFRILENWLLQRASRPLKHHPAVCAAMEASERAPNSFATSRMSESVQLSQRRFIELFRNEVGLTPKLFSRIQRFHQVVRTVARSDRVDWLNVAISCGYFDQAHFIHDFREFSGLTPSEYLGLRTEHLNHVQVNG